MWSKKWFDSKKYFSLKHHTIGVDRVSPYVVWELVKQLIVLISSIDDGERFDCIDSVETG